MMPSRTLYHFELSPFSRRVRLALMHKGLTAELVEGRTETARFAEAQKLCPLRTAPILVEPDGRALGDSTAIAHYLDAAYPAAPRIWPEAGEAARATLEATTLMDAALHIVVDLATRYDTLADSKAWSVVVGEMTSRAQAALDALAPLAEARMGKTWTDAGWSAADFCIATATIWVESWPGRAAANPRAARLMALGIRLPEALSRWTDTHRGRPDITALG
jgi:glutathione S-transferase